MKSSWLVNNVMPFPTALTSNVLLTLLFSAGTQAQQSVQSWTEGVWRAGCHRPAVVCRAQSCWSNEPHRCTECHAQPEGEKVSTHTHTVHENTSSKPMHVLHFHLSSVRFRPGPRLDSTPRLTLVALRRPAPPPRSCLPPRPPYPPIAPLSSPPTG